MNMPIFSQQVLNGISSKEEISLQLSGSQLIAVHPAQILRASISRCLCFFHFQPSQTRKHSHNSHENILIPERVTWYIFFCWSDYRMKYIPWEKNAEEWSYFFLFLSFSLPPLASIEGIEREKNWSQKGKKSVVLQAMKNTCSQHNRCPGSKPQSLSHKGLYL